MEKITGFIITAGHLDIEWYQPLRSYRFWTIEAIEDLKKAAQRPDFNNYVLDGQVYPLEEYLEVVPDDEMIMRELIKDKKLSIGPFYTQFDEWIPSTESIIRNCLYGKRISKSFGGYMSAGYLPDNFGHPLQLPQILRGFGIDSLMFMRGMPEVECNHPDEFNYRGIDGSTVLASHFRESYAGAFDIFDKDIDPIQPREVPYYKNYLSFEYHKELAIHDDPERIAQNLVQNVHRIKERYPSQVIPLIAGYDHLPPQINIADSIKLANEMQNDIVFVVGSAEDYANAVKRKKPDLPTYDMELIGSRYQYILLGALSTRTYIKQQHFACENLLERYVEPLVALAALNNYEIKPRLIDEAWKYVLINSAHDSIHGSSVDEVHNEMETRYSSVLQISAGIIHDVLSHLSKITDHWWDARNAGMLTYSPIDLPFIQPVEVWLPIKEKEENSCVVNDNGEKLTTQIINTEEIEKNSIGLPRNNSFPIYPFKKVLFMDKFSRGELKTHTILLDEALSGNSNIYAGNNFIENDCLRVDIEGSVIHITDKISSKKYYNLNIVEDEADAGDAWDFSSPWLQGEKTLSTAHKFTSELIECGKVRATIKVSGSISVPKEMNGDQRSYDRVDIPMTFLICMYKGLGRVDVKLSIENYAKDHRMRLRVPTGTHTAKIMSQGHAAIIERPVLRDHEHEKWRQPPTQLLPCREWVAVDDGNTGLAIAVKGLYDYEAAADPVSSKPDIFITLLRGIGMMSRTNMIQRAGAASDAFLTPGAQCLGSQKFEWAYIPYTFNRQNKAPFLPLVHSFLLPPVVHAIRSSNILETNEIKFPLFDWADDNVQFSVFKQSYDRSGYILRLYENQGKSAEVEISISCFSKVWICRLDEKLIDEIKITNEKINITFEPYKIVSLFLKE